MNSLRGGGGGVKNISSGGDEPQLCDAMIDGTSSLTYFFQNITDANLELLRKTHRSVSIF